MWKAIRCTLITHLSPGDSVTRMFSDMASALDGLGVSTTFICMRPDNIDYEYITRAFQQLAKFPGPKFLLDINGKVNLHLPFQGRQVSLLKEFRIPRLVQMIDHPALHEHYLAMDHHKTLWNVVAQHHVPVAEALMHGGTAKFSPHGGPSVPEEPTALPADRPIGMLFCGNVGAATGLAELCAEAGLSDQSLARALLVALAAHLDGGAVLSEAVTASFRRAGFEPDRVTFGKIYSVVERWVVADRRRAMLAALPNGSGLMLCGNIPRDIDLPNDAQVTGAIEFADFLDAAANSRILVNSRSPFGDGAHERVFYGLSRGAAVLTDGEPYLAADSAALPLAFYRKPAADLAEAIEVLETRNAARTSPDQLREEAAYYAARHSWTARLRASVGHMIDNGIIEG